MGDYQYAVLQHFLKLRLTVSPACVRCASSQRHSVVWLQYSRPVSLQETTVEICVAPSASYEPQGCIFFSISGLYYTIE